MLQLNRQEVGLLAHETSDQIREHFFIICEISLGQSIGKKIHFEGQWVKIPKGFCILSDSDDNKNFVKLLTTCRLVATRKFPEYDGKCIYVEIKPITRLIDKPDPELDEKYTFFISALAEAWKKKVKPCQVSKVRFSKLYKEHGMDVLINAAKVAITVFPHDENGGQYLTAEFITRPAKLNRFLGIVPVVKENKFGFTAPSR